MNRGVDLKCIKGPKWGGERRRGPARRIPAIPLTDSKGVTVPFGCVSNPAAKSHPDSLFPEPFLVLSAKESLWQKFSKRCGGRDLRSVCPCPVEHSPAWKRVAGEWLQHDEQGQLWAERGRGVTEGKVRRLRKREQKRKGKERGSGKVEVLSRRVMEEGEKDGEVTEEKGGHSYVPETRRPTELCSHCRLTSKR